MIKPSVTNLQSRDFVTSRGNLDTLTRTLLGKDLRGSLDPLPLLNKDFRSSPDTLPLLDNDLRGSPGECLRSSLDRLPLPLLQTQIWSAGA
jgi:hypothetical protein